MNREQYRAAVESVRFREDFKQDTVQRLRQAAGQLEKENPTMNVKHTSKMAVLAAALAALLVVSAAAVTLLLSPRDVAEQVGDPALAAAFESADAVPIDEHVDSGDYRFTLAGLVSGSGLSGLTADVDAERTYVVLSAARLDGQPMGDEAFQLTFTPLISGYEPWWVNIWTLNGGRGSFEKDGVAYYLYECDNLELFADRTVYLAAYEGDNVPPSPQEFTMDEDGAISFTDGFDGAHALFTLPLDASKADPAAADQLLDACGIPGRE